MEDIGNQIVDIFVVGGGINGCGIARDAAGRNLSVVLCEKNDLSEGTSSRSGKLVHGGLRYLEYYQFRLVREALTEREILLKNAPHIVWPLRFVLPHSKEQRPAWLIRLGLFLYDHIGGRKILPASRGLDLKKTGKGAVLKEQYNAGFEFSDCWIDDSRMVILNAMDAKNKGALILPGVEFTGAARNKDHWAITTRNKAGETRHFKTKCIVNASGPWVECVIDQAESVQSKYNVRLVKGSHLVIRKFWEGNHCFLFQNNDKRVIFVNPFEGNLALIGTTDIPYDAKPDEVSTVDFEKHYLLNAINVYLKNPVEADQIIYAFSGVRPLFDDGSGNPSAVTRDYLFEIDDANGQLPMLSIFGGKITTFRELSEKALNRLTGYFPQMNANWTEDAPLPGGDIPNPDFDKWLESQYKQYPKLNKQLLKHYGRLYGTLMDKLLNNVSVESDLGRHFGGNFYQIEAEYLIHNEWASSPADILERRTKHVLHLTPAETETFSRWFNSRKTC